MKQTITKINNLLKIRDSVKNELLPVLFQIIEQNTKLINAIIILVNRFYADENNSTIDKAKNQFDTELLLLIKSLKKRTSLPFQDEFQNYFSELNRKINSLDEIIEIQQHENRYSSLVDDNFIVRFIKFIKSSLLKAAITPTEEATTIQKIWKSIFNYQKYWTQKIPAKNITKYYFLHKQTFLFQDTITETNNTISRTIFIIKEISQEVDFAYTSSENKTAFIKKITEQEIKQKLSSQIVLLEELKKEITESATEKVEINLNNFNNAFEKAGTAELSKYLFNNFFLKINQKRLNFKFENISRLFANKYNSIIARLVFNQKLFVLKNNLANEQQTIIDAHFNKTNNILFVFERIIETLKNRKTDFENFKGKKTDFQKLLTQNEEIIKEQLTNKQIPETIDIYEEQNFSEIYKKIIYTIKEQINKLSAQVLFVKSSQVEENRKIRFKFSIPLKKIISQKIYPEYIGMQQAEEIQLAHKNNIIKESINQIDNILLYNINSAILNTKTSIAEAQQNIVAKINDTLKVVESIKTEIDEIKNFPISSINSINFFSNKIDEIINTEKTFKYKAQAILLQSTQILGKYLKILFKQTKYYYKQINSETKIILDDVYDRRTKEQIISKKTSDFLIENTEKLNSIPQVYKELFTIKSLTNKKLMLGFENELQKLNFALENWKKKNYSSVLLTSDVLSGTSSLLNIFLNSNKELLHTHRINLKKRISTEKNFISLLNNTLKTNYKTIEQVRTEIHKQKNQFIIVIENLEYFFLKTEKGINLFNSIIELSMQTSKQIFWLATINKYSYNFIEQTTNIINNFRYIIEINPFTNQQIQEAIENRNTTSDFHIQYLPSQKLLENRKFQNKNEFDRQIYLKNKFFNKLNNFTNRNIGFALLYWLSAIKKINKQNIFIKTDFETHEQIAEINTSQIEILQNLLIHKSLNCSEFAEITNQTENSAKEQLLIMKNTEILLEKNGYFSINKMFYLQIIRLLDDN